LNEKLAGSFNRAIKNGGNNTKQEAIKHSFLYTQLLKLLKLAHNG
jgi:hypothetical protein